MKLLSIELRQVAHSRLAVGAIVLLALLSALSVWTGLQAVSQQRAQIERIAASHAQDFRAIAAKQLKSGSAEAGSVGYYLPHLTVNPPSPLAFAAIGQRDLQPAALRVRLLGLQAQLYESEAINPELAMPGRFDFAFVLVYLTPLFAIALMHDLVTSEREAGRLRLLASLPGTAADTWRRRVGLRYALVWLAALLPVALGATLAGAGLAAGVANFAAIALVATLYLGFWFGLAAWVAARARTSAGSAAILLACLVGLTMILPTLADAAIARLSPVSKGVELALAQRQAVHAGWDVPKPETFEKFFRTHPEWQDTAPVTSRFHWKWYYAMHQAGDDAVAADVARYRASMLAREDWTARAGLLLAPVNALVLLHRLADTDLAAQLAYQERIEAYHTRLRLFFYPYLFEERALTQADLARLPRYAPGRPGGGLLVGQLLALGVLAALMVVVGLRKLRNPV